MLAADDKGSALLKVARAANFITPLYYNRSFEITNLCQYFRLYSAALWLEGWIPLSCWHHKVLLVSSIVAIYFVILISSNISTAKGTTETTV